jgi:hypothetical protein
MKKEIKCAVRGCKNRFIRAAGSRKYCTDCAKTEQLKRQKRWVLKNIERVRKQKRECQSRRRKNPKILEKIKSEWKEFYKKNRGKVLKRRKELRTKPESMKKARNYSHKRHTIIKTFVLSHYGKGKKLLCSWRGCCVSDIDCLSLDHVNNDGYVERQKGNHNSGVSLYYKLIKLGYPEGFQTLCWNHQWKKEILKRKKIRRELNLNT